MDYNVSDAKPHQYIMHGPDQNNSSQSHWADKYHYREAPSINSCELCSFSLEVDEDGKRGVEALLCSAGGEDTGTNFSVDFAAICDLFLPDIMDEEELEEREEEREERQEREDDD